jgi:3-oxoacyl-[acyl-carrier-protein] synthase II
MTRVVITGIGVVSPVGIGRKTFWKNVTAGRSGIAPLTHFDATSFPVRIGGEVKGFNPLSVVQSFPEAADLHDRKVLLGLSAAAEAISDASLSNGQLSNAILAVGVGLETIGLEHLTPFAAASDFGHALVDSAKEKSRNGRLQTPLDCTARLLGDRYGFRAGRYTNCSACAAGTQVVGEAWRMLCRKRGDVALVGATDSMLNPLGLGGFSLLRVLSAENDQPQRACRPFDATRQGTVLGEGAGFLVLETLEHARRRNARIYAEMLGYGSSFDAFAVTDPNPNGHGAVISMRKALQAAQLTPEDIDCVSAHGTGTPKNDAMETAAIKEVLGGRAYEVPIHSLKSMTGHMIAASGAVETIAAALCIAHGTVPPTINLVHRDRECDLDYVPGTARQFTGDTVLSNSFGFGGQNATVILRQHETTLGMNNDGN